MPNRGFYIVAWVPTNYWMLGEPTATDPNPLVRSGSTHPIHWTGNERTAKKVWSHLICHAIGKTPAECDVRIEKPPARDTGRADWNSTIERIREGVTEPRCPEWQRLLSVEAARFERALGADAGVPIATKENGATAEPKRHRRDQQSDNSKIQSAIAQLIASGKSRSQITIDAIEKRAKVPRYTIHPSSAWKEHMKARKRESAPPVKGTTADPASRAIAKMDWEAVRKQQDREQESRR